jgi:hypothetical protein
MSECNEVIDGEKNQHLVFSNWLLENIRYSNRRPATVAPLAMKLDAKL